MPTCSKCNASIPEGSEVILAGYGKNAANVTVCSNCAYEMERSIKAETEDINFIGAAVFGVVAAFISSLIWYGTVVLSHRQWGIIAIAIGWLVAQAVILGSGRKRGPRLQGLSVVITILAMAFSEYLIVRHFAVQQLVAKGYTNIPYILPLKVMWELIVAGIKSDPLILLFWLIAVFEAFVLPARRFLRRLK